MKVFARRSFDIGTWIVVAAVVVQFLLAGLGIFAHPGFFFWHATVNASVIFFVPLLLILVGWYAGVPRGTLGLMAAITGLTLLQSLLLIPYRMNAPVALRALAGLHTVNALVVFWVALRLLQRTRKAEAL
ncbi:MAG: DUF6220 domain-containing protein [Chloroflexota bacterium]